LGEIPNRFLFSWLKRSIREQITKKKYEKNNFKNIFVALIINKENSTYEIYLVNQTNKNYSRVVGLTGAYMTCDEDLIQTSQAVKEIGDLPSHSFVFLEGADLGGLDFVIWYELDLYNEEDKRKPEMTRFSLPKYSWIFEKEMLALPILNTKGLRIELGERSEHETIEEMIEHMDIKPKVYKYRK